MHAYIKKLRAILEASELSEKNKNALYNKLSELSAEADRSRTRYEIAMDMVPTFSDTLGEAARRASPTLIVEAINVHR